MGRPDGLPLDAQHQICKRATHRPKQSPERWRFSARRRSWCGRRDLNPHDLRRSDLNRVRLPVPPRPHIILTPQEPSPLRLAGKRSHTRKPHPKTTRKRIGPTAQMPQNASAAWPSRSPAPIRRFNLRAGPDLPMCFRPQKQSHDQQTVGNFLACDSEELDRRDGLAR